MQVITGDPVTAAGRPPFWPDGAVVATLAAPSDWGTTNSSQTVTYTVPAGTLLDPSTTYFVTRGGSNYDLALDLTDSGSESGETGWTLEDTVQQIDSGGYWNYVSGTTGALQIAVKGAVRSAPPAAARPITLVENIPKPTTGWFKTVVLFGQGFTTGDNESGYDLAGTHIRLRAAGEQPVATVEVRQSGPWGTHIATLENPDDLQFGDVYQMYFFAAPAGTQLLPGTKYFVVILDREDEFHKTHHDGYTGESGWKRDPTGWSSSHNTYDTEHVLKIDV